jgi:hypothetical protein
MRTFALILTSLALMASQAHAEKIVIVGDSITCGPFGDEMVKNMTSLGHTVTAFCSVSSAPKDWIAGRNVPRKFDKKHPSQPLYYECESKRSGRSPGTVDKGQCFGSDRIPPFDRILGLKPDRMFVAMGTNSLPDGPDRNYDLMVQKINEMGIDCDWIGPPHLQPLKPKSPLAQRNLRSKEESLAHFYSSLNSKFTSLHKSHVSCDLQDSQEATKPGTPGNETKEGLHATKTAAAFRYRLMASQFERALKHVGFSKGYRSEDVPLPKTGSATSLH